MKVSKRALIKKLNKGIDDCGWEILNGLGSPHWKGGGSWNLAMSYVIEYLKKKGIDVSE